MNLSICTWVFGDRPLEDTISFAASAGFDEVEILVEDKDWELIKRIAADLGITIRGLDANARWTLPTTDLSHIDGNTRRAAIAHFRGQIDNAVEAGAEYLVLSPCAPGKAEPQGAVGDDWDRSIDSIRALAPYAGDRGLTLIMEPLNRYESCIINTAVDAKRYVAEVGLPNVKTMLDTYHMNIEEDDLRRPFSVLGEDVALVHVADSNRRGVGRGRIEFEEVAKGIRDIGYDGTVTLEAMAPGPGPFNPNKDSESMMLLDQYARESVQRLREIFD